DPGEMKDLNTLIGSHPEWTNLQEARSINDSGQIVGFGTKSNGETHAFLLTPSTGFTPTPCLNPTPTPTPTPTVTVSVSPTSVTEDGNTNLVYTFTRTNESSSSLLTENFSVGGGINSATFGTDYTLVPNAASTFGATSGTVTFAANSLTATVTLHPTADSTVEPNETVVLTVTAASGYNVGTPATATGTITNDDTDVTVAVSS